MAPTIQHTPPAQPDSQSDGLVAKRLLSISDYMRMGEVGIIAPDERVELIKGEVYRMTPIGPEHLCVLLWLAHSLRSAVGHPLKVVEQGGLEIPSASQVQPDIMVLREPLTPPPRAITPPDVALVVEVSASSIQFDRGAKLRLYAESKLQEYWIVDIKGRVIESYSDPRDGEYRTIRRFTAKEEIHSIGLSGIKVSLADLFDSLTTDPT